MRGAAAAAEPSAGVQTRADRTAALTGARSLTFCSGKEAEEKQAVGASFVAWLGSMREFHTTNPDAGKGVAKGVQKVKLDVLEARFNTPRHA